MLPSIERLAGYIAGLPGIGEKTAERLALHLFYAEETYLDEFASALTELKRDVRFCTECYTLSLEERCPICASDKRENDVICVVEDYADLLAFEGTGEYNGVYHVLHGLIAPLKGVSVKDIRLAELFARVAKRPPREVIIAFDAGLEGDTTAQYIVKELSGRGITITRIAYGISLGSDIEHADTRSLARSLEGRQTLL